MSYTKMSLNMFETQKNKSNLDCFKDKPGRGNPVSQLLTVTQLSQWHLKTRGSGLFTSIQVVQI